MPNTISPRGITVSFEASEIDWLYWVMQEVLTTPAVTNTAKDKIITAYNLLHENEANNQNMG
jgi:hypothetical protein